jgi:hypothetical protein
MTGRFLDRMFQRNKLISIMSPGNVTTTRSATLDKNVLPSQSVSCIKTGERPTCLKNGQLRLQRETSMTSPLDQFSHGTTMISWSISKTYSEWMELRFWLEASHSRITRSQSNMDHMSQLLSRCHLSTLEAPKRMRY